MAPLADLADCRAYDERRLSMDSSMRSWKRANLSDSGLCLVCGRRATGRCSKCAIATFCGPQCQQSASCCHSGACEAACGVLTRGVTQRWLPRDELSVLQHMIVLVGQSCNPVSSAKDRGLQGCKEVLKYAMRQPGLLQRYVADFVLMGCQALMKHKICCNPHIYTFCILDGCLKKGSVEGFAESIGVIAPKDGPAKEAAKLQKRYMDWQRTVLLPMQEMFGQIGIGRYWEAEPAPIEAGMASQHSSPNESRGSSPEGACSGNTPARSCKASTGSWVNRHSRSSHISVERTHSIPAHV